MALIHLKQKNYSISQWSGGTTTQVAIAPEGAVYADRDFLWRISSATVDLEESDFTALPDYHRWISTLKGSMKLQHESDAPIQLSPYEVHEFDGGIHTHSWGCCTDFNLMLRKGKCQGVIRSIRLTAGEMASVSPILSPSESFSSNTLLVFCGEGNAAVTLDDETIRLESSQAVLLKHAADTVMTVAANAPSAFMVAEIQY